MNQPLAAAPVSQASVPPGDTLIPMGTDQPDARSAYRAVLDRVAGGGRVRWAAATVEDETLGFFEPGAFIVPGAHLAGSHTSYNSPYPLDVPRAYSLQAGGVALLRTTVQADGGQAAAWELAYISDALDLYLLGALDYSILAESDVTSETLGAFELLIVPSFNQGMAWDVINVLQDAGALDAIEDFVRDGGTLYTQGNGAIIAEEAGLLPLGTVDWYSTIPMPATEPNRGVLDVIMPDSPLAYSWLTSSLYILSDPLLYPDEEHQVIATVGNADTYDPPPAILRAGVEAGQVIVQVGHPTDKLRREQMPLFMNAVLLALGSKGELTGQAVQTFNADLAADVFPAYEAGIPVSATLTFANLWDEPLTGVVITAAVSNGFDVLSDTVSPAPAAISTVFDPVTQTLIVWELGSVEHGEVRLSYVAETQEDVLAPGTVTFDHSQAVYQEPSGKIVSMQHSDRLNSLMAARLVGDRDVEPDRVYYIPASGVYLDVALALENKESTLGSNLRLTDVLYLVYPIVDLENQNQILATEGGETVWMRNEAFFWDDPRYPLPQGVASAGTALTLDDWGGDWCVFTSTVPSGTLQLPVDLGDSVTIPPSYSDYITLTAEGELLLPCLTLNWDLGDFPGYWYEEPATRYGVHSRELFSRSVTFSGDTAISSSLVVSASGGSVYVTSGGYPVLYSEFLAEARPFAALAPVKSRLTWTDVWARTGELPLRASFYDVFGLVSCPTCDPHFDRHAAVNLTFGLLADLDGDGVPETPVRELPTRLAETDLNLMLKSYSLGPGTATIPADENIIDLPIFNGLGIKILPREDAWENSWNSPLGRSQLVSVTYTPGYDHLYFQQEIPDGVAEVINISSTIQTYENLNREGMFKLHDGARFHYRQVEAGPNRYETYDSHMHTVVGLASDAQVSKDVGPRRVSIYGDTIYYLFSLDDPYDPRAFSEDPYMQSWGYGDLVATTYVGGRQEKELFHSILSVGDRTWIRVQIDNNHGETLTGVQIVPQPPPGISVTPLFTDPATAPEPIWPELAFLNLQEIPDAWRGVYYFEVHVTQDYPGTASLGDVLRIPIDFSADNPPAGFEIPPATIAIRDEGGAAPRHIYGPANNLTLTDTLPPFSQLQRAVRLDQAQVVELWNAIDAGEALTTFAALDDEVFFTISEEGLVSFSLPIQTLPADAPLYIVASAAISEARHGANTVNDGAVLGYDDVFGVHWTDQSYPETVEALGAAVWVEYFCGGGAEGGYGDGVEDDGGGSCWVPPGEASLIVLWATAYNYGDDIAENVTITLDLDPDVIPTWSDPPWQEWVTETNQLTWGLGDLAPGSFREMEVFLEVEPDYPIQDRRDACVCEGDICACEEALVIVEESRGSFVDAFSARLIQGRLGNAFSVWVQSKWPTLYLPILFKGYSPTPDLVPLDLTVTPGTPVAGQATEITLVLQNQGAVEAMGEGNGKIWIDFYVDPKSPPEANQLWESLCPGLLTDCQGGVWIIDSVAPGEVITLTASQFDSGYSRWEGSFAAGDHTLYVYVDTWDSPEPVGTVLEFHEDNNRFGPMIVTVQESNQARFNRYWFRHLLSRTRQ